MTDCEEKLAKANAEIALIKEKLDPTFTSFRAGDPGKNFLTVQLTIGNISVSKEVGYLDMLAVVSRPSRDRMTRWLIRAACKEMEEKLCRRHCVDY